MTIENVGNSQPLSRISNLKPYDGNSKNDGFQIQHFKGGIEERLNKLLKQSPLDDRFKPDDAKKCLARQGFGPDPNKPRGLGDWYTDGNGNRVNVVSYTNGTTGDTFYNVTYTSKNGMEQIIVFDKVGNPIRGELKNPPIFQGLPTETYKYEFDAMGKPQITSYNTDQPPYVPD